MTDTFNFDIYISSDEKHSYRVTYKDDGYFVLEVPLDMQKKFTDFENYNGNVLKSFVEIDYFMNEILNIYSDTMIYGVIHINDPKNYCSRRFINTLKYTLQELRSSRKKFLDLKQKK